MNTNNRTPENGVSELQNHLSELAQGKDISAAVAREALEYHDPEAFFHDICQHGCASWMVGSMIYYCDTHAFFDAHYDEIEQLRWELEENLGEPLVIDGDLKNWFAWFAFEETAYKIASEWEVY